MLTYLKLMHSLKNDRRGVTAVEYAVVAGAIVVAIATAFTGLATGITNTLTTVVTNM